MTITFRRRTEPIRPPAPKPSDPLASWTARYQRAMRITAADARRIGWDVR